MRVGKMRDYVEIQKRVVTRTATGDEQVTFVPIDDTPRVWASIVLLKPREGTTQGASMIEAADFKIDMYWRSDIVGAMRIVHLETNELYDLTGPMVDENGSRRSITGYAVRRSIGLHA